MVFFRLFPLIILIELFILPEIYCKIIDLTWDFDEKSVYWPGTGHFNYTSKIAHYNRGYWYASNNFCAGEHGGTHLDAPYHFNRNGWKVADIPIERLLVNGATIIIENSTNLQRQHLDEWHRLYGEFKPNTVLIVVFNWSKKYKNVTEYFGKIGENLNFPGLTKEAAEWLGDNENIVGVGVDTASLDPGDSQEFWAHRTLLGKQKYGLENVKVLERLPTTNYKLIALPMKLKEGTGGPVRIIALVDDN